MTGLYWLLLDAGVLFELASTGQNWLVLDGGILLDGSDEGSQVVGLEDRGQGQVSERLGVLVASGGRIFIRVLPVKKV